MTLSSYNVLFILGHKHFVSRRRAAEKGLRIYLPVSRIIAVNRRFS